jgi:glycosyltransferase involved in cell wall biosynthesis
METAQAKVTVHVIVPARNEEDCIGRCLESLVGQQGITFQITVVDDGSADRTHAIAESFPNVQVISAAEPLPGVMGKCNALITGASGSTAKWLLFTDADTVHYPGSLAAAVKEAEERRVDLLSYSPEQEVKSWWELAVMPLVFADLVRAYPPEKVNDPVDSAAAANGQYILARREVYEQLGGHSTVAGKILEDVELARIFKVLRHKIWFRQGTGLVRTRMYRTFSSMWEGWTKNLALLFRHPLALAAMRGLDFITIALLLGLGLFLLARDKSNGGAFLFGLGAFFYLTFVLRIRRAHFPWRANLMSFLGLPLFVSLLVRSYLHTTVRGELTWKGRKYSQSAPEAPSTSSIKKGDLN